MVESKGIGSSKLPHPCPLGLNHGWPKDVGSGSSSNTLLIGLSIWPNTSMLGLIAHQTNIHFNSARGYPKDFWSINLPDPHLIRLDAYLKKIDVRVNLVILVF